MKDGKIYRENMKKAKLELSEFMVLCRQEGYFNINDIEITVFEYNGRMTILPKSEKRPLMPEDMQISPEKAELLTEIIMDGRVLQENLERLGLNLQWLEKQLRMQHYKTAKEIFLGICDSKKNLTLFSAD